MWRLELVKRSADMDYVHRAPDKGRQTFDLHGTKALIAVVTTERRLQFVSPKTNPANHTARARWRPTKMLPSAVARFMGMAMSDSESNLEVAGSGGHSVTV